MSIVTHTAHCKNNQYNLRKNTKIGYDGKTNILKYIVSI